MVHVRKCGNTIEFEFPDDVDESGRPLRIHFGSDPDQECLDRGHLHEKKLHNFRRGGTWVEDDSLTAGRFQKTAQSRDPVSGFKCCGRQPSPHLRGW
jgi:hypothetical protein